MEIYTDPPAQVQRDQVGWVVHTEDGRTFHGFGATNESWLEFADMYYSGQLTSPIRSLWFRFRDHYEEIGAHSEAFYFAKAHGAWMEGESQEFFVGGYLNKDGLTFHTKQFSVPELLPVVHMEKDRDIQELIPLGIIWKDRSKRWIESTLVNTERDQSAMETTLPNSYVSE